MRPSTSSILYLPVFTKGFLFWEITMTGQQAAFDQVRYLMSIGQIQANQANVEIVRIMGVRLIEARITRAVRTELNRAVKSGRLGHLPKDGLMPEAYFHPKSGGSCKCQCVAWGFGSQ